ncbi:MAG: DEAD/DEAH box helicase [Desulfobacteraceae bacterium]|nr:DEAD/DEAH box helicase [Desulfobacteraceae bacterium]
MQIRLTPNGLLRLEGKAGSGRFSSIYKAFQVDWRQGLFELAAQKVKANDAPTLRYWQEFAWRYLTRLCHICQSVQNFQIDELPELEREELVVTAAPMPGGEYLSGPVLDQIWQALDLWVHEQVDQHEGLSDFLKQWADKWCQVGRVCFHLAENKNDETRPFAFMATYTTGFGADGKLKHLPLHKALEQYAGARKRAELINLLEPIQQAADTCGWVRNLVSSGKIYQPLIWSCGQAYLFLKSVQGLEDSGLSVRLPNWWKKRPRAQVSVTIGEKKKKNFGVDALLDFKMSVALGDQTLSPEELAQLLNSEDGLVFIKGQWVEVDRQRLQEAIEHWEQLKDHAGDEGISFIEGMRLLAGASVDLKHEDQAEKARSWVNVTAGEGIREILARLRDPGKLDPVASGNGLQATLRPYQHQGVGWLHLLTELGLGACLADDMGLGKTIQVLALLLSIRKSKPRGKHLPSLLILPASLLGNWRNEATRFAPELKLLFLHQAETDRPTLVKIAQSPAGYLKDVDLAVTTYSMVTRQNWLEDQQWRLLILDEAQAIKNPGARQTKAVKRLFAHARIALTGTPVENRLGDLWSLFDFINPGLLGSTTVFKSFIKNLEERSSNRYAPLRKLVGPYLLRRLKTDRSIIADLPEKTETSRYCPLSKPQVKLYQHAVRSLAAALAGEDAEGIRRRGLVLQTLMRLKQICNHPSQFTGDGEYTPSHSGKFLRLGEICQELAERQQKVLIFTQFREIIDPLEDYLAGVFGRKGLCLHGGTSVKKRKTIVDQFQGDDGPPFFILSLKAGGTGLNLTAAAHVVHFDRWWNPAVENQATDRAFRIGQKRNVLVHKFITQGTIEERIDALINEKRQLAEDLLSNDKEVNIVELPDEELIRMVSLDVTRAAL